MSDLKDIIARQQAIIDEHLHKRRCRDCDHVAYYKLDRTPYVLCPKCGSQDTRRMK